MLGSICQAGKAGTGQMRLGEQIFYFLSAVKVQISGIGMAP